MAPVRNTQTNTITDTFSEVMSLVYSRLRWGAVEASRFEAAIYQMMVDELTAQIGEELAVIGCSRAKSVNLTNPTILANVRETAKRDAVSIVDTYNRDLAYAVRAIRTETPTANRNVFIKRIDEWARAREAWKNNQIALNAISGAKNYAIKEFVRQNGIQPKWYVDGPNPAAEPECQELIDNGPYDGPTPPRDLPLHRNCPHVWRVGYGDYEPNCQEVWAGE